MKQMFASEYKKNFHNSVRIILIENQELQNQFTEMKRWEGNN